MNDFKGKVAVITGGAEGIGKAIAIRAAAEGMKLVLADIDAPRLDALVSEFSAKGVEAAGLKTDVSNQEQIERLARFAYERFGSVHLLVNNAGVASLSPAWEVSQGDWEWVMGVNFYGVTHALRAFIPRMLAAGEEGHIVNTASAAGLLTQPGAAAYNASKFAVVAVSESLHYDLTLRGAKLKVSVLCPAWVKTRITESDRYRTPGSETHVTDELAHKIAASVVDAVQHGISPEKVADDLFEAVAAGRFYILTHPEIRSLVRTRMEDIINDRIPTFVPMK